MREIALHLLDLAENSVTALADQITIQVTEDLKADKLWLSLQDNGKGMPPELAQNIIDPFFTSRTTRKVGLGIPFLKAAAQACNGDLSIFSKEGEGTRIEVELQHSHIDRMPLGDLAETLLSLIVAHPEVNWMLNYKVIRKDQKTPLSFVFDDRPMKEILDGISLCEPEVLLYLRNTLNEGIRSLQAHTNEVSWQVEPKPMIKQSS